jgi:hypothetical protein
LYVRSQNVIVGDGPLLTIHDHVVDAARDTPAIAHIEQVILAAESEAYEKAAQDLEALQAENTRLREAVRKLHGALSTIAQWDRTDVVSETLADPLVRECMEQEKP